MNAQHRFLDALHYVPNEAERMKWARQYMETARSHGFPVILWDNGGGFDMGLIDRRTAQWTEPRLVDTFLGAWHGRLDDATFAKWVAEVEAKNVPPPPPGPGKAADVALRWAVGGPDNYSGCWGQSMGYGNVNGNGAALTFFTFAADGSLHVDTHGAGGNMVHQQFWADRGLEARRSWAAWTAGHPATSAAGRMLHCALTAKNGTSVLVKGFFLVPGLGKIPFGADNDRPGCFLATPERPPSRSTSPCPPATSTSRARGSAPSCSSSPAPGARTFPSTRTSPPLKSDSIHETPSPCSLIPNFSSLIPAHSILFTVSS